MASAAEPHPAEQLLEYAAAANPRYEFVPNKGYIDPDRFADAPEGIPQMQGGWEEDEDEYDSDADEELFDDELNDQDWTESGGGGGDFTKSYNRQRKAIEATRAAGGGGGAEGVVKGNKLKPKPNVATRVDDQIRSLTKFAGRIKLGDVESGMGAGKGDRYILLSITAARHNSYGTVILTL